MAEHGKTWKPTLRLSIRVVLAVMILLTAGIITLNSYLSSRKAILGFSRDLVAKSAEMVRLQVVGYMTPAKRAAELAFALVRDGLVRVEDFAPVERYFFDCLSVQGTISMLNYGNQAGEFLMVKRMEDGSLSTKVITVRGGERRVVWRHRRPGAKFDDILREEPSSADEYDPRVRPWYTGAARDRGLHWTEVYVFYTGNQPGITTSVPLYAPDGRLKGVIAVDIGLYDVSHFLKERIRVGKSGQAFLLDRAGRIIASRQVDELTIGDRKAGQAGDTDGKGARLRMLEESARPEVAALASEPAFRKRFADLYAPGAAVGGADTGTAGAEDAAGMEDAPAKPVRYRVRGVDYIAGVEPIDIGGRRWLVGVVAAEDDFLAEAKRANVRNAVTAALLTFAALVVGGVVGTVIARSLGLLVRETSRLQQLEFVDEGPMSSRFLEVHQVLEAFNRMKMGLRAFGKYVPMTLVRQLLHERVEPRPGAAAKEITLFFSDIRDFTTKSERMSPAELAEWLSRYLSSMTECLHAHGGTVDKYLGDGVMAFWGAPAEAPDHAAAACRAALDCAGRVEDLGRDAPGEMDFYTRIGIHSATVAVGNFGSADRLNYTAMGDGVNLASRLEGTCKVFGTQTLISEDTYSRLADRFETRKIGLVAVKGRGAACAVYELLAEKGRTDGEGAGKGGVRDERVARAREYERALGLYLARKWDEALGVLDGLLKLDPADKSYAFLADACRAAARSEPPPDWDGVFTMTSK